MDVHVFGARRGQRVGRGRLLHFVQFGYASRTRSMEKKRKREVCHAAHYFYVASTVCLQLEKLRFMFIVLCVSCCIIVQKVFSFSEYRKETKQFQRISLDRGMLRTFCRSVRRVGSLRHSKRWIVRKSVIVHVSDLLLLSFQL